MLQKGKLHFLLCLIANLGCKLDFSPLWSLMIKNRHAVVLFHKTLFVGMISMASNMQFKADSLNKHNFNNIRYPDPKSFPILFRVLLLLSTI